MIEITKYIEKESERLEEMKEEDSFWDLDDKEKEDGRLGDFL